MIKYTRAVLPDIITKLREDIYKICKQKEFVFSLGLFNQEKGDSALIGHKSN